MNIESIQPELAAFELDRIGREETDATATAALTRLLHDVTGCDIPQTSDLPESEVEELVPLCVSILRRHWQTPLTCLGDGTTPMSLADLLQQLIDGRVNGNEALGIPPANANIPTALTALRERKIDAGFASCPDGLSIAQLIGSGADQITELTDTNIGWTFANNSIFTILKAQEYHLNCVDFAINASHGYNYGQGFLRSNNEVKVLDLPYFEGFIGAATTSPAYYCYYAATCNALEELLMPSLWRWNGDNGTNDQFNIANCPNLRKVVFGSVRQASQTQYYFSKCPNLIHLEFGQGTSASLNLTGWLPSAEILALPEFLSNFKTYIAHRLTDKGSGLTLTLSPAVRDAIQQDPEIVSIITSKGWTISPAPSV